MADKSIGDLNFAPGTVDDSNTLFVVQQAGAAYKLSGHNFILALTTVLDGHGGVKSITYDAPVSPSLTGTMTITLADDSTTEVDIQNGKGITSISKTGTSGLVDTYTISYNDGTTSTFTVSNGAKGDTGDSWYVWIRYAGQRPTSDSDIGTVPDDWIGIYSGTASTAPTSYTAYSWYEYKGEKGDTGTAASITQQSVTYQESASGTVAPSGSWVTTIPSVTPGNFLWTKTQLTFNDGSTVTIYSVSRYGIDGTGAVSSVNGQSPDGNGNVALTANNVPTADNLSIQAHIEAAEDDIDDLQSDMTTAQNDIMALDDSLNAIPASRIKGKQIAIYGDSWAADYHGSLGADYLTAYTGETVHVVADPGGTMQHIAENKLDSFVADIYIVIAGLNDLGANVSLNYYLYYARDCKNHFKSLNANAEVYFVTPPMMRTNVVHNYMYPLEAYRIALWRKAPDYGFNVINSLKWTDVTLDTDKTHPILADADKIGKHIADALINYGDEETHIMDYSSILNLFGSSANGMLVCDGGNFYIKLYGYTTEPDSGTNEKTLALPSGMSSDIGAFVGCCMSGSINPIFVFHNENNANIKIYRATETGTIYIGAAYFPINVNILQFNS